MIEPTMGLDIALNHSAAVVVRGFDPIAHAFMTDAIKVAEAWPEHATLYRLPKGESARSPVAIWARLEAFHLWACSMERLARSLEVRRVGVENYAFSKSFNAYQIGEFGGVLREAFMDAGWSQPRFELVDPGDVKVRAGLARRSKDKPIAFCRDIWGADWLPYNAGFAAETAGDLSDAHVVAVITGEPVRINLTKGKAPKRIARRRKVKA